MRAARGRVVDEPTLVAEVERARAAGRRVVLTNGAFDLLHVGHVRMLEAAAALGDVLVVAVNGDEAVRAAKGAGRPLVPAAERAEVLAAVAGVSLVHVFADRTVARLLEALRPHVHAKGREYDLETLPERAVDERLGVEIAFVGDAKTHASTEMLARAARHASPGDVAALDVVREVADPDAAARGIVLASRRAALVEAELLDFRNLVGDGRRPRGTVVEGRDGREVRRLTAAGTRLYVKTERARSRRARLRGDGAVAEMRAHLSLRAAGFRAPEPWLALDGKDREERRASAFVAAAAAGAPLDEFLAARLPAASPRERAAWARGIGAFLRALHTARYLPPDLHARHLFVDGDPAGGVASITPIDLARLARAKGRVRPEVAAPGLAALALTLRPCTTPRFRLAVLRAYLGGTFREGRAWMRAVERRIVRVEGRSTYRARPPEGPP